MDDEHQREEDPQPVTAGSQPEAPDPSATARSLFENRLVGFALHEIVLDETGAPVDYIFLDANTAFGDYTGLVPAEILGRRVTEVIPGITASGLVELYGKVALGGKPQRFETHVEPLGRYYDIQVFSPLPGRFATAFLDVTERRDAERDLKESRRFLQRVLDVTPDLIYIFALVAQRHVVSNREIVDIFGYTPKEILEMGSDVMPRLLHADDVPRVAGHHCQVALLAEGEILEMEYRMRRRDGTWCWLRSRDAVFRRGEDGAAT